MNAEAKTLADLRDKLRAIVTYAPVGIANSISAALAEAEPVLDRLSAPVEGVGLTRWSVSAGGRDDETGELWARFVEHDEGEWVDADDATAALATEKAKTKRIAEGVLSTLRQPCDQSRQDDEYLIEALLRERADQDTAIAAKEAEIVGLVKASRWVEALFWEQLGKAFDESAALQAERDALKAAHPWPEGPFAFGDRVEKSKGSSWHGRVCGWYSTSLTLVGYCVESEREPGSVQLYPAAALSPAQGGE